MLVLELVTVVLVLQRASELVLARRNAKRAFERGGVEFGASHYPFVVVLHAAWFIAFNAESIMRSSNHSTVELQPLWTLWASVFVAAQFLRYWSISSLGDAWNTRIIVVPGSVLVRRGPYTFLPHPNYVAVMLEFISVPLLVGAPVTALIGTVVNGAMLWFVRLPAERAALKLLKHE